MLNAGAELLLLLLPRKDNWPRHDYVTTNTRTLPARAWKEIRKWGEIDRPRERKREGSRGRGKKKKHANRSLNEQLYCFKRSSINLLWLYQRTYVRRLTCLALDELTSANANVCLVWFACFSWLSSGGKKYICSYKLVSAVSPSRDWQYVVRGWQPLPA